MSTSRPLVSVIIPVYDDQKSVKAAVQSVLMQTYDAIEIIVVDDNSSPQIKFDSMIANSITLLRNKENKGPAFCRNLGVKSSKGDLISFLDSDDTFSPTKIKEQVHFFLADTTHQSLVVGCGAHVKRPRIRVTEERFPIMSQNPNDFFCGVWFFPGSAIMMKRGLFETIGGFDDSLRRLEDYEFFLRFAELDGQYVCIPKTLCMINRTHRASRKDVSSAVRYIIKKHFWRSGNVRRQIKLISYLSLELGATHFFHKNFFRSFMYLSISILCYPRTTKSLKTWWPKRK